MVPTFGIHQPALGGPFRVVEAQPNGGSKGHRYRGTDNNLDSVGHCLPAANNAFTFGEKQAVKYKALLELTQANLVGHPTRMS